METLLLAILAVLVVIVVELGLLLRKIDPRLRTMPEPAWERDKKEGATIHVNVGTISATPGMTATVTPAEPEHESVPPAEPVDQASAAEALAPPPPPPPRPTMASRRSDLSTSGPGVIKCPKCSAENSSFRTECFKCEAPL
jgi:hypothetical protein